MKKILFVCTGNSCRSVMAEGLFKKLTDVLPGRFTVLSAGTAAIDGFPASAETIKVLKDEEGIDMASHRSRRLTEALILGSDKIFVMEQVHKDWVLALVPEAAKKVFLLTEFVSDDDYVKSRMDVPDPIRMSGNFYKNVFGVIRACVKKIADQMIAEERRSS